MTRKKSNKYLTYGQFMKMASQAIKVGMTHFQFTSPDGPNQNALLFTNKRLSAYLDKCIYIMNK